MEAEARSRDLLQRFAGSTTLCDRPPPHPAAAAPVAGDRDDVELSLGLSLGGCFSSNPREEANKLIRSSSISSFPFLGSKDENFPVAPAPLHRTCSLPVPGADEDYRKRKELQTLRRLEAKRKRSENRSSSRGEEGSWLPPMSQGSIGSVGSSSSSGGGSMQGFDIVRFSNYSEGKSSLPDHTAHGTLADGNTLKKLGRRHSGMGEMERSSLPDHIAHRPSTNENTMKKTGRRHSGLGEMERTEMERTAMEEMPCVSTRGNGPNGKRIEGFLYKYRKGEEVRIVCVCHGRSLTPAEFVRHAGGGDVDHPLRHIVVNPPSPFL